MQDPLSLSYIPTLQGGDSTYFTWVNRGKESLVADVKAPRDLALLRRMLREADVFVQNLAPGAIARLGGEEESSSNWGNVCADVMFVFVNCTRARLGDAARGEPAAGDHGHLRVRGGRAQGRVQGV